MSDERTRRERALVEAARADAPPDGARERVLVGLGISTAASLAGAKAAAAAPTAVAVAGGSSGAALLAKSLAIGAAIGLAGMAVTSSWPGKEPPVPAPVTSATPALPSATSEPPAPAEPSTIPPPPEPLPEPLPKTQPFLHAPPSAAPSAQPVLAEQVAAERALLDGARQSLESGRASTAVKTLGDYQQRFGFGILGHEAVVLKMKALVALGRRPEARVLGERYLQDYPAGTQALTVRRLLGAEAPPASSGESSDQKSEGRP
jgi:hypothetical protein